MLPLELYKTSKKFFYATLITSAIFILVILPIVFFFLFYFQLWINTSKYVFNQIDAGIRFDGGLGVVALEYSFLFVLLGYLLTLCPTVLTRLCFLTFWRMVDSNKNETFMQVQHALKGSFKQVFGLFFMFQILCFFIKIFVIPIFEGVFYDHLIVLNKVVWFSVYLCLYVFVFVFLHLCDLQCSLKQALVMTFKMFKKHFLLLFMGYLLFLFLNRLTHVPMIRSIGDYDDKTVSTLNLLPFWLLGSCLQLFMWLRVYQQLKISKI